MEKTIETIKVIFLDFDGVLNNSGIIHGKDPECIEIRKRTDLCHMGKELSSSRIQLLNQLVEKFDNLFFVVSSTWRKRTKLTNLQRILNLHGFKGTLLDITPNLTGWRGAEIQAWLDTKPNKLKFIVEQFLILDDEIFDMLHLESYVVKTSFWGNGLEQIHIDEIIERFNK